MNKLHFYYDIVCPYAYLASCKIDEFAKKGNWQVTWIPILLGGLYKAYGSPQKPSGSWGEAKRILSAQDLKRQAERIGVTLNKPQDHPFRTVEAMRALCACPNESRARFSKALFNAYWVDNLDVSKDDTINQIASSLGLSPNLHREQSAKDDLRRNTDLALSKGIFGVPSFYAANRFWWGQDRLILMEAAFDESKRHWPDPKKTLEKVTFFHDFSSPFSYLAFSQIKKIERDYGLEIDVKPILLGGLFKQIGTPNVPMFEMNRAKQAYMLRDLKDWANYWKVDFAFPKTFPLRSVLPLRVSLLAPQITADLYDAYWVEGRDISRPEVIEEVAAVNGIDGEDLCRRAQEVHIKNQLKKNTSDALNVGACGVPTFVWNGQVWWGQDRILSLIQRIVTTD